MLSKNDLVLASLLLATPAVVYAQGAQTEAKIRIQLSDIDGNRIPNIQLTINGVSSGIGSDGNGYVALTLPRGKQVGDIIKLEVDQLQPQQWVILGTAGKVAIPKFTEYLEITICKSGDPNLLKNKKFLELILSDIVKDANASIQEGSTLAAKIFENSKRLAEQFGFPREQLNNAIQKYTETTTDIYQKAFGKFYAQQYAEAEKLFGDVVARLEKETQAATEKEKKAEKEREEAKKEREEKTKELIDATFFQASACYEQGKYYQALTLFQKVDQKQPKDPKVINYIGITFLQLALYKPAEEKLTESLKIYETTVGKQHPHYASSLNNLAGLYKSQGRYEQAEPLYKEALSISSQVLGKLHPDHANSLNNLAGLYYSQGRYEQAEPLLKEALSILSQVLGKLHPDYANSLNNLAGLYYAQGRYEQAEPLYKEALSIYGQVLGKQHPNYKVVAGNLAVIYQKLGRKAEAKALLKEVK